MGTFMILVLESAACLALFYLLYKLALSKDTFHRFNRVALLVMLFLSVVIPLGATLLESAFQPKMVVEAFVEDMQVMDFVPTDAPAKPFPYLLAVVLLVYVLGLLFFLGRLLRNWLQLATLLRKCKVEKLNNRLRIYTHERSLAPFSWMHAIVVSTKDLAENRDIILTHELAHIKLGHSWDLLVADLCILVQWFNPAAWLLRQELQVVHEFEADDKVLQHGIDAKKYQLLIIEKAVGTRLYSMANSLNHGSLKKRITMMLKQKSNPWARAKYAVVLPLAAIALLGFAQPEFTNLQARSAGEIDEMLSLAAAPSPSVAEDKSSGNSENPTPVTEKNLEDAKPLIVLDGKLIQPNMVADINFREASEDDYAKALKIDPKGIKEITVLKGDAAVALYGEKGRNGVLEITTIKKKELTSETDSKKATQLVETVVPKNTKLVETVVPKGILLDEVLVKGYQRIDPVEATKKSTTNTDEQRPQYPGGHAALMEYIRTTVIYPSIAIDKGIQGTVYCSFVVDATGKVTNIKVSGHVDPSLDAEALRVVSGMPNWMPGKKDGKNSAFRYALPIVFSLDQYQVTAKKAEQ